MPTLLAYVRRAFELPPRQAVRAAHELAAIRTSALRQRIAAVFAHDRVGSRRLALASATHGIQAARLFESPGAVLPIRWMAVGRGAELDRIRGFAADAIAHRFDLLGSGPVQVAYGVEAAGVDGAIYRMHPRPWVGERQRRRMDGLVPGSAVAYEPIDWHIDFKSGYRWSASQWFSRIEYGHRPGVDVKVPWELSRFQHTGALGLVHRLDPTGAEGRRAALEFRAQVVDWIAANPPARGVNWACPMDVALRAVSWLSGVALFADAPELTPAFRLLLARSLHAHGRHIEANLEYQRDRTGNHYLSDVVGLLCIGAALPELAESSRWCLFGIQELVSEMERQVLPDGADIEGSIPYHHLVAELFYLGTLVALRLGYDRRLQLQRARPGRVRHMFAPQVKAGADRAFELTRAELFPAWYLERLLSMAEFARSATKPDGRVPQTGDNDNGRAYRICPAPPAPPGSDAADDPCDRRTLLAVAGRLFGKAELSKESGDFAIDAALLVADAPVGAVRAAVDRLRASEPPSRRARHVSRMDDGALTELMIHEAGGLAVVRAGPLYLAITLGCVPRTSTGGHFHNDLLGFELQWDGVDFICDGGSYVYTPSAALRDEFRATAAHSTLVVDGIEQRTWPLGVGRLFSVQRDAAVRILDAAADSFSVEVEYDGVRHVRTWAWTSGDLRIEDDISAPHPAALLLNLAPAVTATPLRAEADGLWGVALEARGRRAEIGLEGVRTASFGDGYYSLGYGRRLPNQRIRAESSGARVTTRFAFTRAAAADRAAVRAAVAEVAR